MASTYSYTQIADLIKDKIYEILSGKIQSYSYSGKSFTFLNIKELISVEQEIRQIANDETSNERAITNLRIT